MKNKFVFLILNVSYVIEKAEGWKNRVMQKVMTHALSGTVAQESVESPLMKHTLGKERVKERK